MTANDFQRAFTALGQVIHRDEAADWLFKYKPDVFKALAHAIDDGSGLLATNQSQALRFRLIFDAASALIADVKRRYPGEELRCPYMIALDDALKQCGGA